MTEEQIKTQCESHFQAGGSRVQLFDERGCRTSSPADLSAARALELSRPGERVFARRKVRGERRYAWVLVGTGS
jgi:hypothetical protein